MTTEEYLFAVPPSAILDAINAFPKDKPLPESLATMSLMLDIDSYDVKSVASYARIWRWTYDEVRYRIARIERNAKQWLTWYGSKSNPKSTPTEPQLNPKKKQRKSNKRVPRPQANPNTTPNQPQTYLQYSTQNSDNNSLTSFENARDASKSESKPKRKPTRFTKPDISSVIPYFLELKSTELEAQKFFDHFEANGWRVGGRSAMKDWKAAARNWCRNALAFNRNGKAPGGRLFTYQEAMDYWQKTLGSSGTFPTPHFEPVKRGDRALWRLTQN